MISYVRNVGKTVLAAVVSLVFIVGAAGCGNTQKDDGPDYADDEAMSIIAKAYQKRSDVLDQYEQKKDTDSVKHVKDAVQAEIDNDEPLKERQFKDSKLQGKVITYINLLEDSQKVNEDYSYLSSDYSTEWTKVYDKRSALLKDFVDNYKLTVDSKYQDPLNDIVANGSSVKKKTETEDALNNLIASATFEKTDDGYGYYAYSAVIENISGIDFGTVNLILALYDADGVKAAEVYASTNAWPAGEKVKFETGSDADAAQVKASVDHYEVDD